MSDNRLLSNFSIRYWIVKWQCATGDSILGIGPILPSLEERRDGLFVVKLLNPTQGVSMSIGQITKGMWPLRKRMIKSTIVSLELEIVNWALEIDG